METYTTKESMLQRIKEIKQSDASIGFVPTMGALHAGHLALVSASLKNNDFTVVSIFVNPTQFDNQDDLAKYPRTLETDIALLKKLDKAIIVYHPSADDLYDEKVESQHFNFGGLENEMEGKHRPGHFDGVGTVVKKLFKIVQPDKAYFGEKDFQQLQIIKKLVVIEKMPIQIVPIPIYREPDGLAMSSRNTRLTPEYRSAAPFIYQTLQKAKNQFAHHSVAEIKRFVADAIANHPLLELEYFEIANEKNLKPAKHKFSGNKYRGFIVVYAGDIRLIDNIALT